MSLLRVIPTTTRLTTRSAPARRLLSSQPPNPNSNVAIDVPALHSWAEKQEAKQLAITDRLSHSHLADLFATLPTRANKGLTPTPKQPLPYGHHLAFFHRRLAERDLRWDGTDMDFCPPEPFTRRMWAGGAMHWSARDQNVADLSLGDEVTAKKTARVALKGLDAEGGSSARPMVFVNQEIAYENASRGVVPLTERQTHVFLPPASARGARATKEVTGLPKADFSFEYLPTPTTLFRFSALTFNAHYIHLDKDYAINVEGYPERLVHGPFTAMMLLDVTALQRPNAHFMDFEYRAHNPLIVNNAIRISGAWDGDLKVQVWAESILDGVVGMTGTITFYASP